MFKRTPKGQEVQKPVNAPSVDDMVKNNIRQKPGINFSDVKPRTIIRYKNNINGNTYTGLVYSISPGMANIVKITDDENFANPETKISSVDVFEGKNAYANPFYCTSSVRLFSITEIVGTISDMEYFNIISAMVNVYMGIYHIDSTSGDRKWVLDTPVIQNPITAMLFGMCSPAELNNRLEIKDTKKKEKEDAEHIKKIRNEAVSNKPSVKKTSVANSEVSVKKDAIQEMAKFDIFSMATQKRIDAIWAFFSEYSYFQDRLNVYIIYDMMFDPDIKLTTRRLHRSSFGIVTKDEFANIITLHPSEISKQVFFGNKNEIKCAKLKTVCESIFAGKVIVKSSGKSNFTDDELKFIEDEIEKGSTRKSIGTAVYKKRSAEGTLGANENLRSLQKAVDRFDKPRTDRRVRYKSVEDAFIGHINKRNVFSSYPNVESLIDEYVNEIQPNIQQYVDMSKVYHNDDTMLNAIMVYIIGVINSPNYWITMFSNPAYRDLMERFNKEIDVYNLPGDKKYFASSCVIGMKLVAIATTMPQEDKEYLISIGDDLLSLRRFFKDKYKIKSRLNACGISVLRFLSEYLNINIDNLTIAFSNSTTRLAKMQKKEEYIIPAED